LPEEGLKLTVSKMPLLVVKKEPNSTTNSTTNTTSSTTNATKKTTTPTTNGKQIANFKTFKKQKLITA